jgi:nucleoside-diphosphate-sugar epimerase
MKVLLTGGTGFIGPHLVDTLTSDGHELLCPVRRPPAAIGRQAAEFITADLNDPLQLKQGVDVIIHCAGTAPASGRGAADIVADNLNPTRRLIEFALRRPPKIFIYFSTMSVYGAVAVPVVDESTPIVNPSAYGMAKLLSEELLSAEVAAFPTIALRLPAVLGAGAWGHWLSFMLAKAYRHDPIRIFNPSARFNNAVDLSDLLAFISALIRMEHRGFERLTLSFEDSVSIEEAATTLLEAVGSESQLEIVDAVRPSFTIDSSRARDHFGFRSRSCREAIAGYGLTPPALQSGYDDAVRVIAASGSMTAARQAP